jgi:hypothetical protein
MYVHTSGAPLLLFSNCNKTNGLCRNVLVNANSIELYEGVYRVDVSRRTVGQTAENVNGANKWSLEACVWKVKWRKLSVML